MFRTPWHVTYALHYASLPLSSTDPSMLLTYLDTCIMALTLLVPVAVDVVVDWSWYAMRSQVASHDLKLAEREMLSLPEKLLLVVGLAVAPITGVPPSLPIRPVATLTVAAALWTPLRRVWAAC